MKTKSVRYIQAGLALGFLTTLSACGGGGGGKGSTPVTPPTVVTTGQEDKFGTKFGQYFRADMNSEPSPVADTDIVPISLTDEPIAIVG